MFSVHLDSCSCRNTVPAPITRFIHNMYDMEIMNAMLGRTRQAMYEMSIRHGKPLSDAVRDHLFRSANVSEDIRPRVRAVFS